MLRKTNTDSRKNHTILLKYLKIWLDIDLKIILLKYQNYYVKRSSMSDAAKNLDVLASLSVLHNYFDSLSKLSVIDLYLTKFLDTLAKSFFPCSGLRNSWMYFQTVSRCYTYDISPCTFDISPPV